MNTKLNSKYRRYFHDGWQSSLVASAFASIDLVLGVQEWQWVSWRYGPLDIDFWHQVSSHSKDIRPTNGVGVNVGVQYLGEGGYWCRWCQGVGVKGVRDAKESPARCRFARWSRRSGCRSRSSSLQWRGCLQGMSSTYDESLSGCGRESCEGCISSGSSSWSVLQLVSGPAGQWLAGRQDQSPCGRGFHCRL